MLFDGFGNFTSARDRYKIRLVRSGSIWYAQRTADGVTSVSTRTPLNYRHSPWTTWYTIEVPVPPSRMPPLTFDPVALQRGLPRPVYARTHEAASAKMDLVVLRTADLGKGGAPLQSAAPKTQADAAARDGSRKKKRR